MPIATAVRKGGTIYVYDENGRLLFSKSAGTSASDGLQGYTGQSVSIRLGATVYTYDARGRLISSLAAR